MGCVMRLLKNIYNHLFCGCKETWLIWMKVLLWWGLEGVLPNNVMGLAEPFLHGIGGPRGKDF